MKQNEAWRMDGAFSRNYSMFGLVIIVYFCGIFLLQHFKITFYFLFIIILFYTAEFKFHKFLVNYTSEPKTLLPQKKLFIQSFLYFGFTLYLGKTIFNHLPAGIYTPDDISFISTYTKTFIFSLLFFQIFLSIKQFSVASKLISIYDIKRGIFGLWYRIVVIFREIIVSKYWLQYLTQDHNVHFIDEIFHRKFDLAHFYIAGKAAFMVLLIWDLDNTRRFTSTYIRRMYHKGKINYVCSFCKKPNMPLVCLKCEHYMCEACANRMLKAYPFCPVCKQSPHEGPYFSYPDGYVSFTSVFCCF